MAISTSNVLSSGALLRYLEKQAIRQFRKDTFFYGLGEKRTMESGSHTYVFNLMDADAKTLAQSTLTEGVTPVADALTFAQVEVSMTQLGNHAIITDVAAKDNPFPLADEAAIEIGRKFAQNVDIAVQNVLNTGTNTIIKTVGDVTTVRASLVAADIFKAKRIAEAHARLRAAAAPTIEGSYVCLIHPNVQYDLFNESATGGFIDLAKYQQSEKIFNGEIGKLFGVKIIVANNIQPFVGAGTGPIDVYPTYFLGARAYAVVESQGMETIVQPFGSEGSADPLKQRMSVGIKIRFGAALLKSASLWRVESSASIA